MGACTAFVFAALIEFTVVGHTFLVGFHWCFLKVGIQLFTISGHTFCVFNGVFLKVGIPLFKISRHTFLVVFHWCFNGVFRCDVFTLCWWYFIHLFPFHNIQSHLVFSSGELPLPERLSFWVCSQFVKQKKSRLLSGTTKHACKAFTKGQKQRLVFFLLRIRFIPGITMYLHT